MNPLNNCYESISSGPTLVRRAGTLLAYVLCLEGSWGWLILDDFGFTLAAAPRYTLDARGARAAADERLAELAAADV